MATSASPDSGPGRATQTFIANLSARTEGQLAVAAHAPFSLMKPIEIKEAVRRGVVSVGELTLSLHAGEAPIYGLDSLPLLAFDYAEARRLYEAQKPALDRRLSEEGLKLLYSTPYLAQSLCAARSVASMADLKGFRLRVYNHLTKKLALYCGAQPVAVETNEIALAINTNRIDGFVASVGQALVRKAWIVAPYFHDLALWIPRSAVIANRPQFEALPAEIRKAMAEAARFAEERAWDAVVKDAAAREAELAAAGGVIVPASAAFARDLGAVGRHIAEDWLKVAGPDGPAILDAYGK